jgi:hypothetical protein
MATSKQIAANRGNARQSTGPRSEVGKERSSTNACKHGLTAESIIIGDEDPADFDRLRAALEKDFAPRTTVERELIEGLAASFWRLRRIPTFEAALLKERGREIATLDPSEAALKTRQELEQKLVAIRARLLGTDGVPVSTEPDLSANVECIKPATTKRTPKRKAAERRQRLNIGLALIRDCEQHDSLSKLTRYEAGLRNSITRTLNMLYVLRASRIAAEENQRTI